MNMKYIITCIKLLSDTALPACLTLANNWNLYAMYQVFKREIQVCGLNLLSFFPRKYEIKLVPFVHMGDIFYY